MIKILFPNRAFSFKMLRDETILKWLALVEVKRGWWQVAGGRN
jgi:hypothetical protein